jgi:carboxyl-terminal processing protease
MKTTSTILNRWLTAMFALTIGLCLFTSTTEAADFDSAAPNVALIEISNDATFSQHSEINKSEGGIPLAREDVVPLRTAVTGTGTSTPPSDDGQAKISGRYTETKMLTFLARTNLQQLVSIYREASQMIDARHVNPPSYEDRTRGAIEDVIRALNNAEFLRAGGVQPNPQTIVSVQNQLRQLVLQPARDVNQATALMQSAAEVVSRGTGIRREAVALEFLNGTLDSLDKYSAFLPESAGNRPGAMIDTVLTASLEENMVGIGVELKQHEQGVEIVGIVDQSPAQELGLVAGDVIIAINQQPMGGKTLNEVADRLSGPAGSGVTVDILRDGKKYRGSLVRRSIYVGSVSGTKMIDPQTGLGYIRVKQFSQSTAEDLEKSLWTLHQQGMRGLILDLRGNPGGLLDECVDVSNLFVPYGTIVSTRGRNATDNTTEVASYDKTWSVPLVVLVDENSASASEIFAAAIQENHRGVIVGRRSYGKGTVQTHFPMSSVPAILKLTTAKFYSPNGREMAGAGVTPDVPVNAQTTGYRGSDQDADIQTAMQVMTQGTPAQLVAYCATLANRGSGQQPTTFRTPGGVSSIFEN